ncbi:hypothetical protein Mapa_004333 [Marchantia paleacea]|nr:hypothetical protein Mapa_004333 [Marchantia paleacea]
MSFQTYWSNETHKLLNNVLQKTHGSRSNEHHGRAKSLIEVEHAAGDYQPSTKLLLGSTLPTDLYRFHFTIPIALPLYLTSSFPKHTPSLCHELLCSRVPFLSTPYSSPIASRELRSGRGFGTSVNLS